MTAGDVSQIYAFEMLVSTQTMTAYCIMPAYCDGLHRCDEAMNSTTTAQLFSNMPDIVDPRSALRAPAGLGRMQEGRMQEECKWFSPASLQFSMLC